MGKFKVPPGWVCQAYRFEVDRPSRHPAVASHQGARRSTWNWALGLIEEQLHAREVFRVLAIHQGAPLDDADEYTTKVATIPSLVELNDKRREVHEARVKAGTAKEGDHDTCSSRGVPEPKALRPMEGRGRPLRHVLWDRSFDREAAKTAVPLGAP